MAASAVVVQVLQARQQPRTNNSGEQSFDVVLSAGGSSFTAVQRVDRRCSRPSSAGSNVAFADERFVFVNPTEFDRVSVCLRRIYLLGLPTIVATSQLAPKAVLGDGSPSWCSLQPVDVGSTCSFDLLLSCRVLDSGSATVPLPLSPRRHELAIRQDATAHDRHLSAVRNVQRPKFGGNAQRQHHNRQRSKHQEMARCGLSGGVLVEVAKKSKHCAEMRALYKRQQDLQSVLSESDRLRHTLGTCGNPSCTCYVYSRAFLTCAALGDLEICCRDVLQQLAPKQPPSASAEESSRGRLGLVLEAIRAIALADTQNEW
eukprot:COSAG01_NODE_5235_length_4394_cov_2.168335_2_plen_316_part_00